MWEHHFSGLVDNQKLGILSDHLDNNGWYVSSTGEQSSIDLDYRQAPDIEFDLDIISEFAKENHLTSKKSIPETEWLYASAKVPELCTRTQCTLSTLISLSAVTEPSAA